MKRKLGWIVLFLLLFLYRESIWQMLPCGEEELSLPAAAVAIIGGICLFFLAKAAVVALELREVWQVGTLIVGSSVLIDFIGHWLAGFASIGEFWGGFVAGALEGAVLWGALYGAKELWQSKGR